MPIISRAKVNFTRLQDVAVLLSGIVQYCIWTWVGTHFVPTSLFYEVDETFNFVDPTAFYITSTHLITWILLTLLIFLCFSLISSAATFVLTRLDLYFHHGLSYRMSLAYGYIIRVLGNVLGASDDDVDGVIKILYTIVLCASSFCVGYFASGPVYAQVFEHPKTYTPILRFLGAGLGIVVGFLLCHLLFRVAFIGRLSRYPKQVFGLDGMFGEYFSISLFFMNFGTALVYYSYIYNAQGTYKPSWLDKLG